MFIRRFEIMGNTFPKYYDFFMDPLEKGKFQSIRKELLQKANGVVLEVGSGTPFGLIFLRYRLHQPYYFYARLF